MKNWATMGSLVIVWTKNEELGDGRGEESFAKSAKLSLRKDEVLGVIDKLKYQDK